MKIVETGLIIAALVVLCWFIASARADPCEGMTRASDKHPCKPSVEALHPDSGRCGGEAERPDPEPVQPERKTQ